MNLLKFMKKSSAAGSAISAWKVGKPEWTPRNYAELAKESYQRNVIAYKCIQLVAGNFAQVPWILLNNGEEVEKHPILDLLNSPNPSQTGSEFFRDLASYFMCSGNSYIEAVSNARGIPGEMYAHRPDRMKVIPGRGGMVQGYEYEANGVKRRWEADIITGKCDIKHLKTFHPLNDWYGMSPLEAAAWSVDQHNESSKLNAALLQNGLFLGGLFTWKNGNKENLEKFQQTLWKRYTGAANAGQPMVIGGEVDWVNANISPKDIQFLDGKKLSAAELCLAFGVNPILIFNESVAYNNVLNARRELWEDTVIPMLDLAQDALNAWLIPMFGAKGLELKFDVSETPVMIERNKQREDSARGAYRDGLIKKNEARRAMGYDDVPPEEGGEEYYSGFGGGFSFGDGGSEDTGKKSRIPFEVKTLDSQSALLLVNELDSPEVVAQTSSLINDMLKTLVIKFGEDVIEEIGNIAAFENTIRVQDYIIERTGELIGHINNTTRNQIQNEVLEWFNSSGKVDDLASGINKVFDNAAGTRAKIIAQTESTGAAGFGALEALTQSGVEKMEWFTSFQNSRDAHVAMDGQKTEVIGGFFHTPSGAKTRRPGGFGVAELDINCNCAIGMALNDEDKSANKREEYWERREQKRIASHPAIEKTMEKVFNEQRKAIINRLKSLEG